MADVSEHTTVTLLRALRWPGAIYRSSELAARPGRSERLADLASAVGAAGYLCGTGGSGYLDPAPFTARGLHIAMFTPPPHPDGVICHAGRRISALTDLAAAGPESLAAQLGAHALAWKPSRASFCASRLDEAAVFCVFFKDTAGRLTAGVVDAGAAGLCRQPVTPAGLSGWAWGELHLDGVRLRRRDILARPGKGMDLLREHFAHYRPLVAATALGAAAAACDSVAAHLDTRRKAGFITGPRDNALITLGRAYAQINAAMLAALTAQRLSQACDEMAELWGCAAKAHGADVAYTAASELALLAGAPGFAADSQLAKARRDLNGLLYADGIHDSLYRTVGRTLTTGLLRPDARVPLPRVAQDRQSASCSTTTPGPMIRSPGSRLPARSPSRPRPRPGTRRSGEPAARLPAPPPHLVRRTHTRPARRPAA